MPHNLQIALYHNTPQHTVLCQRGQDLFCICLLACPPLPLCILWLCFAGVHGSSNIFLSVHAHFCCLATCVFVCADVSVGVGAFVCVQNKTSGPNSEQHPRTAKTAAAEAAASQLVSILDGLKYAHRLRGCGFRR